MVKVKICGIRTLEGARAVQRAGADFVGLNFVPWSSRCVSVEAAIDIACVVPPTQVIGVFFDASIEDIREIAARTGFEWVQLHGKESPAFVAELRACFRIIKAFRIDEHAHEIEFSAYSPNVDAFLLDAPQPGSGRTFDWTCIEGLDLDRPFFLSGGLSPDNVARAIREVRPYGVDVASGVEVAGVEDSLRIEAFVREARHA